MNYLNCFYQRLWNSEIWTHFLSMADRQFPINHWIKEFKLYYYHIFNYYLSLSFPPLWVAITGHSCHFYIPWNLGYRVLIGFSTGALWLSQEFSECSEIGHSQYSLLCSQWWWRTVVQFWPQVHLGFTLDKKLFFNFCIKYYIDLALKYN